MSTRVRPGDVVYLVPTLPTAPTAAYATPQAAVVAVAGPRVTVRVIEGRHTGQEITTDDRNVSHTRPEGKRERTPHYRPRPPMPDGYTEVSLF